MFRQRTSTQKPGDELLANFRQQFPQAAVGATTAQTQPGLPAGANNLAIVGGNLDRINSGHHDAFTDQDPTPRATNEPWRFTPSLMDPNSFAFSNFANAPPGYYTPTPGGNNTIYHSRAGDLHTPTMGVGMGLGTPLSMPAAETVAMPPSQAVIDPTGFQTLPPHQFHHFNPFIQAQQPQQPPGIAPSSFVHQDTGYETMEHDGSPMDSDPSEERMTSIDKALHQPSPMLDFQPRSLDGMAVPPPLPASAEKFRFHATLNAPTAMIKNTDEVPITYLNKGQAYSLSIVDTNATMPVAAGTKYRTFVRVSFEDEEQRQKPGVCWGLWKEGRGSNEAHQRGGKLQAVEFVEAKELSHEGDDRRTRTELEQSSFDGFSVTWTPGVNGGPECSIAVRFNFLSTDFSHSKGVKGIPVRLCAKTTPIPADGAQPAADGDPEICFCKVKLFRDHGAERKLSNDVAHVRKTMDKLKQQIAQAESGMKDFGKRKRASGNQPKAADQRPGKVQKHKRTWSMSSASSSGAGAGTTRPPIEEELHFKLQTLQDMFTSTRPVSVLYLRGEDLDDPDTYPVSLPGESGDLTKVESRDSAQWQGKSGHSSVTDSSWVSPSPSSLSLASQVSGAPTRQLTGFDSEAGKLSRQGSDQPTKVAKTGDNGNLSGWLEALGVDPSYQPPPERNTKPVACFYVIRKPALIAEKRELHKAIYLSERTLKDFNFRLARKWNFDPSKVLRTVHVLQQGLEVEMDDDVIQELKEGQDMTLEVVEVAAEAQIKQEWEMAVDLAEGELSSGGSQTTQTPIGYELRLTF